MHENHEPSCLTCQYYILPFQSDSPLSEWGYCTQKTKSTPDPEKLAEIEKEASEGNFDKLFHGPAGLFQGEGDGCPLYVEI